MPKALTTNRYVKVGTYIGQLINPKPGDFEGDGRLPVAYAKGSRLAAVYNQPITRSFIYEEPLAFTTNPPYVAYVLYPADGNQDSPIRLYKNNGEIVRVDHWLWEKVGDYFQKIVIKSEAFDPSASYQIDYQSTSREVVDPIPVEGIREIRALGRQIDTNEYREYTDYYLEYEFSDITRDSNNGFYDREVQDVQAAPAVAQSEITTVTDFFDGNSIAGLAGKYFTVSSPTINYYGWFSDGVEADPAPGGTAVPIDTSAIVTDDEQALATAVKVAFEAVSGGTEFSVDDTPGACAITALVTGPCVDATAGDSAIAFSITQQGTSASAGTGVITHASSSDYSHNYNRYYEITCTAKAGTSGTFTADFEWSAIPLSGGNFAAPAVPLYGSKPTISIDEADAGTLSVELEHGLIVEFAVGASNFDVGDSFNFVAWGPGLVEVDLRHQMDNQLFQMSDISPDSGNDPGSTGTIAHETVNYDGERSVGIALECTAASGASPNRLATFSWAGYKEVGLPSGQFTLDETDLDSLERVLFDGITLSFAFGLSNFVVGDKFTFNAYAPMLYYIAKDDRNYTLDVHTATASSADLSVVTGQWAVDTPEGGFNTYEVAGSRDGDSYGLLLMPNNVHVLFRNLISGGPSYAGIRYQAQDAFTFSLSLLDVINFSLTLAGSQEIPVEDVKLDIYGNITGSPNTYYAILAHTPIEGTVNITYATTGSPSYAEIPDTPYVRFISQPTDDLLVAYRHKGNEPDPGQEYYLTANYIRPEAFYNTLLVVRSRDEGRQLFGPPALDNHAYMLNEIAWGQETKPQSIGIVQVMDADGDGVHTITDYREAILGNEDSKTTTDHIVVGAFSNLADVLGVNVRNSDPFRSRENYVWVGHPIDTPVGSVDVENSLIYTAKKTLQVYGDNPAHGTRICTAPTWVKQTIKLQDGTDVQVTNDGSFYAWAEACKNAGFTDPSDSILYTNTLGFDEVETFTEGNELLLGASGLVYASLNGTGIYRSEEDITVDKLAPDFKNINAMNQKQDVTRTVRRLMNQALIRQKPASGEEGTSMIREFLSRTLLTLHNRGRIADWQDADRNIRKFDANKDIVVYIDKEDPTQYLFYYNYFLKYIIKRLMGLYTVDTAKLQIR